MDLTGTNITRRVSRQAAWAGVRAMLPVSLAIVPVCHHFWSSRGANHDDLRLAALAVPPILHAPMTGGLDAVRIVAGVTVFGVAWRTESVLRTIVAGFAVLLGLGALFS